MKPVWQTYWQAVTPFPDTDFRWGILLACQADVVVIGGAGYHRPKLLLWRLAKDYNKHVVFYLRLGSIGGRCKLA